MMRMLVLLLVGAAALTINEGKPKEKKPKEKIVEDNHMGMEDPVEQKLTKKMPARYMWIHESSSPLTGRKFDQEWALGPGKIYGNGISFMQMTGEEAKAKAHVFVINTADKVDKCHCISAQMADSAIPYSVSRINGATPSTMMKECKAVPKLMALAHRTGTRSAAGLESALFCSNYKAWKEALSNHTDKDYIIIMEDDVLLKEKEHFWKQVDSLLTEKACTGWDHMNVDPYEGAWKKSGVCSASPQFKLSNPTQSGGAHMQIIRREKLQELVDYTEKNGAGLVDRFSDYMPRSIRKYSWKAGLVTQFNTKGRFFLNRPAKPGFCTDDVYKHQVSFLQDGEAASPDLRFRQHSGKQLAFKCE